MPYKIHVAYIVPDTRADVKKRYIENLGIVKKLNNLVLVDAYTIDQQLSKLSLSKIAQIITDPDSETYTINEPLAPKKFDWVIEIGFLPGVTDNIGTTARETIEDILETRLNGQGVYSSQLLFLSGSLTKPLVKQIAESLYNPEALILYFYRSLLTTPLRTSPKPQYPHLINILLQLSQLPPQYEHPLLLLVL